jgi:decaprenylphospho-beta-D-erythro-pentofuranosid-2-ulose 2-reductase
MTPVLIVGATSAIAQETARIYAKRGANLFLAARDSEKLTLVASDLTLRGAASVDTLTVDALDFDQHAEVTNAALKSLKELDVVLVAHGTLSDQAACQLSYEDADREFRINFLSVVSFLTPIANHLESQGHGTIAVISSVAGDRGRQSNYIYGSAKAGLSAFLSGLRNRLSKSGVNVLTIKPGFVDTPMTAHLEHGPLFVAPATIANGIVRAIDRGKDIVYLPFFWRWIMLIIVSIPEWVFKKLSL